MKRRDVKNIVLYYQTIPAMRKLLARERAELLDEYSTMQAAGASTAHASTPGKPTEALALTLAMDDGGKRLDEIERMLALLDADREKIRAALDAINGGYKRLLIFRYERGYSWAKISVTFGKPEGTIRHWNDKALDRLGETIEERGDADALARRASRART